MLVVKRGQETLTLISELFRIGRQRQLLGGVWRLPRTSGFWDQDAFAVHILRRGLDSFALVEHRMLQSIVRPRHSHWRRGDFAAHLTFLRGVGGPDKQVAFVRDFLRNATARR